MFGPTDQLEAERVDSQSGLRERAAFTSAGASDEQVLVFSYVPARDPIGTVVVCPSILGDFLANYRREVMLARSLAAAGMAVLRFHYRGTGNSEGDPARLTLETMATDTRRMTEVLAGGFPAVPIGFVGTRWGALSAATAAADHAGAPLVLCEPLTALGRFFDDAMQSRAMSAIATGKSVKSARQISELLDRDGYADIVGNVVHRALYDSTVGADAVALLSAGPHHPRLLVQFGGRDLRPAHRKLDKQFADSGSALETTIVDVAESWWFRPEAPTLVPVAHGFNDAVSSWLRSQLAETPQVEQR